MPIEDSDQLLVNDGSKTETITFAQYKEGTVLNDTDLFLVNDGVKTETVTWATLKAEGGGGGGNEPSVASVTLVQNAPIDANRFTGKSFTTMLEGNAPDQLAMTGQVVGVLAVGIGTDPIVTDDVDGQAPVELTLQSDLNLGTNAIEVGDKVKANTIYKPKTSTIASVGPNNTYDGDITGGVGNEPTWTVANSERAFDGSLDTYATVQCGASDQIGNYRFMFTAIDPVAGGIPYTSKVRVHIQTYYNSALNDPYFEWGASTQIGINNGGKTKLDNSKAPNGWFDVANGSGVLESFDISCWALGTGPGNGPKIRAFEVDGEILINNQIELTLEDNTDINLFQTGDIVQTSGTGNPGWNETQIWDKNANNVTDWYATGELILAHLFDGSVTTLCQSRSTDAYCYFTNPVIATSKIRVFYRGPSKSWFLVINGIDVPVSDAAGDQPGDEAWYDVPASFPCEISGVRNRGTGEAYAIEIDDKILVNGTLENTIALVDPAANRVDIAGGGAWLGADGSGTPGGATFVQTMDPKRGEGTVSAINGAQVTIDPVVDNCFKTGQYLTANKNVEIQPITDPIAGYDLPSKTLTLNGAKDLLNLEVGDELFMTDVDGNLATGDYETSALTAYEYTSVSSRTMTFDDANDLEFLTQGVVITSDTETTPVSGAITNVEPGVVEYFVVEGEDQTPIDLSTYPANAVLDILVLKKGDDSPSPGQPAAADGGDQGWVYMRNTTIGEFESTTFIPNSGNNFNGVQLNTNQTRGNGGSGGQAKSNGTSPTMDLESIRSAFTGFTWNYGAGGEGGNSSGMVEQYGGGGGGGGLLIDIGDYDGDNAVTISPNPTADTGGSASFATPGQGGVGWGAGSGGRVGQPSRSLEEKGEPLDPPVSDDPAPFVSTNSKGAPGITFVKVFKPHKLTLASEKDYDGFMPGDSVTQSDGNATGEVVSTDLLNSTIDIYRVTGDWLKDGSTTIVGVPRFATSTVQSGSAQTLQASIVPIEGAWHVGSKAQFSKTGTGTVLSINLSLQLITMSESNDQWVPGYYASSSIRPAATTSAYLKFNADGEVTGYDSAPVEPRVMTAQNNVVLQFPETFADTGTAPDVEFPDPDAFIQTTVTLTNTGSDPVSKASNVLIPDSTAVDAVKAIGEFSSNADAVKAMAIQIATYDQRAVEHRAEQVKTAVANFETKLADAPSLSVNDRLTP